MSQDSASQIVTTKDAHRRLPLVRSISLELRDRVEELQTLAGAEGNEARRSALNLRERVRECLSELEGLGIEVESFRPLTLLLATRSTEGEEQLLTWRYDDTEFRPLEESDAG